MCINSSVESQKGAINIQRCSVENQKGAINIQRCSVENQKGAINIQRCSVENQKGAINIPYLFHWEPNKKEQIGVKFLKKEHEFHMFTVNR